MKSQLPGRTAIYCECEIFIDLQEYLFYNIDNGPLSNNGT